VIEAYLGTGLKNKPGKDSPAGATGEVTE
jgi:hypothetical protein